MTIGDWTRSRSENENVTGGSHSGAHESGMDYQFFICRNFFNIYLFFYDIQTLLLDGRNIEKNAIVCQETKHTTYCGPLEMMAVDGKRGSVQGGSGSRRERGEGRNCPDSDKGVPEDEGPGNLGFFSSPVAGFQNLE